MSSKKTCFACELVVGSRTAPGGIIFENDYWQVDHSNFPVLLKGMLIVRLKRHCEVFAEITPAEALALGEALQHASAILNAVLQPERVYVCLFGEALRHIHFFIIPRMLEMPKGSWGTLTWLRLQNILFQLKLRRACSQAEIIRLVAELKQFSESIT